jgi:hypothetical protein
MNIITIISIVSMNFPNEIYDAHILPNVSYDDLVVLSLVNKHLNNLMITQNRFKKYIQYKHHYNIEHDFMINTYDFDNDILVKQNALRFAIQLGDHDLCMYIVNKFGCSIFTMPCFLKL